MPDRSHVPRLVGVDLGGDFDRVRCSHQSSRSCTSLPPHSRRRRSNASGRRAFGARRLPPELDARFVCHPRQLEIWQRRAGATGDAHVSPTLFLGAQRDRTVDGDTMQSRAANEPPIWQSIASGSPFSPFPHASHRYRPVADGTAAQARWVSRGEHSGRQMRHNKPVLSFSSVLTTQSRRRFQAFSVPRGRVTQAAIPRTASFPGAPPAAVCKAKKGAVVMAVASPCAMGWQRGRHPMLSATDRQHAAARPEYQHPALPCQPKTSMLRSVDLDLGRQRFHIYQFPLPYG